MENIETKDVKYSKAFKETYIIINNFAEELYAKIPSSFIKVLKENMNKEYNVTLAELNEKGTMQETQKILSLIYRDFLVDEKTRKMLLQNDEYEMKKQTEKYNKIFEEKINSTPVAEEMQIVLSEKWYIKFFNKIKSFFKKN